MTGETPTPQQEPTAPQEGAEYDHLFDPNAPQPTSVEDAAVRPVNREGTVATETDRQMGIAAADRQNREDAGLPPRTHDLK